MSSYFLISVRNCLAFTLDYAAWKSRDYQGKRVNPPYRYSITKAIRLKLFLDVVPSSFADITRALRGCFRGGSVYVSFRFVLKQSKTYNAMEMPSLIF